MSTAISAGEIQQIRREVKLNALQMDMINPGWASDFNLDGWMALVIASPEWKQAEREVWRREVRKRTGSEVGQ